MMGTELPFKSKDGSVDLQGRDWAKEPRTAKDVILCRLGRHKRVMWGWVGYVTYVERCSCGALGDGRRWTCLDKQAGRR